jgi:predicted nucleotide-binding protein (sugar kinase/HSP70/actin superfamily)
MSKRIVSLPHLGNYYVAFKTAGQLFGDEVRMPPRITKKTLELGTKYSPEAVCIPFKYSIGNYIEALEEGANVLVQAGGGCRMGYYGELQKVILEKLGYKFEFVKLINDHNVIHVAFGIKRMKPELSYIRIFRTIYQALEKAAAIDHIEPMVRTNIGFEVQPGSFERLLKQFLAALDRAETKPQIRAVRDSYEAKFRQLEVLKPEKPLRVGFVGEFYIALEPFSNFFVEKQLAQYGVEVHRFVSVTSLLHHASHYEKAIGQMCSDSQPYMNHEIGGHATHSVADAVRLAKEGFDGLIHVKPFGCMPEVSAMPILQRISRDYQFPILYFSFDSLTSETGIKTRLEAFNDMLIMKKETGYVHAS